MLDEQHAGQSGAVDLPVVKRMTANRDQPISSILDVHRQIIRILVYVFDKMMPKQMSSVFS